jgi:putative ABC transport system permease protein
MFGRVMARIRSVMARRRVEKELDEELRFHVEMETRANVRAGMSPAAARRAALVSLGGMDQTREAVRDERATIFDRLGQDLRYALRRMRREPGYAAAAIVTVGLAVGLATTVYSVAESVLLRPFPYGDPARLVMVWKTNESIDFMPLPVPELLDIGSRASSVQEIGGLDREGFALIGSRTTEWVDAFSVTANLFDVLEVHAIQGRTFVPDDGLPGREHVAVIGEALWRRAFGSDPGVIGRRIQLDAEGPKAAVPETYEVVGIVASDLELFYPAHLRGELYVPRVLSADDRAERARSVPGLITFARIRPGVRMAEAAVEIRSVLAASLREHPAVSLPFAGTRVVPLHEELVGRTRPVFLLLTAAACLLLLIGCVNVANLLLAGGMRRAPEFAARLALGCSRVRLVQQLLTEHLLLACGGGVLGALLAACATPALKRFVPESLPRVEQIRVDAGALAVALASSLIAGLIFGLAPAVILARPRLAPLLKTRSVAVTPAGGRSRHVLVVAETALVLALLAGAALIGTGVWRLTHVPIGFQPEGVLVAQLKLPARVEANDHGARFERQLLARLRALPGVVRASTTSELPFTWGVLDAVKVPGSEAWHRALVAATDSDYLRLLEVPLHAGRLLGPHDDGNNHVVVINEALKRLLPGGQAIGQHVQIDKQWREVVGVAGDITEVGRVSAGVIRRAGTIRVTLPAAYVPTSTYEAFNHFLAVRTTTTSAAAAAAVRQVVRAIDPEVTIRRAAPLEDRVKAAGAETRFCALLVSIFAAVALVLSAVGLFGVLAHAVGQRTREIGIHMALGARPGRVRWIVARRAVILVGSGTLIGLGIALAGGRAIRSFLFEVAPADPWILAGSTIVLLAVAALATWIPVRRAARVDPTTALKCE